MSSTTTATVTATESAASLSLDPSLAGHDEEQIRLMEERCIVLDNDDKYLRDGSKKECEYITAHPSLADLTLSDISL